MNASAGGWSLGYFGSNVGGSNNNLVNTIAINGGVLAFRDLANGGVAASSISMTGGTISGTRFDWYNGITNTPTLTTSANSTTAVISSGISLRFQSGSNNLTINVAPGTTANGIDLLISAPIDQFQHGGIAKSGSGTLELSAANTYNGSTIVNGGMLILNATGGGNTGKILPQNSNLTITSGTVSLQGNSQNIIYDPSSGTITLNAGGLLSADAASGGNGHNIYTLVLNGGTLATTNGGAFYASVASATGNTTSVISGNLGSASTSPLGINVAGGSTLLVPGILINNGASGLTESGSGTLVLSNSNTFTGVTTVSSGTLNLSNQFALQNSTLANGGTGLVFDQAVTAHAFTLGGLSGSGGLLLQDNGGNPVALTVGGNTATYSGAISGSGSLIRTGGGILTLTGGNTYTGGTTFNNTGAGITVLANSSGQAIPGNVQLGNGTPGTMFVQTGAANQFAPNATLTFVGAGGPSLSVLELLGNSQSVGTISDHTTSGFIENTQLEGTNYANSILTINNPNNATFGGTIRNTAGGASTGTIGLNLAGSGGLTLSGPNILYTGPTTIASGGTLTLQNATGFNSPVTDNGTLNVFSSGSAGIAQIISGTGGLVKTGAGIQTLSGSNTYTGPTAVNAGTLRLGNSLALGSLSAADRQRRNARTGRLQSDGRRTFRRLGRLDYQHRKLPLR